MPTDHDHVLELDGWSLLRRDPTGEVAILRDLHLRVPRGRWLAVLGANGSGKSSLLKYLASEESPLTAPSAIMFQDPDEQLVAATVRRELALGRPDRDPEPDLEVFGLAPFADLDPRLLSAGQKQRLALAVAEGGDPEVLLADEPTALQDRQQTRWILDRLRCWCDRPRRTLITATCDRREAVMADDILVLEEGRAVAQGPAREMLTDPRVEALLGPEGDPPGAAAYDPAGGSPEAHLQAEDLLCRFGNTGRGFRLPRLEVASGARLGLTGGNGSGKSTLLALLAGGRRPDGGRLSLGGHRLYAGRGLDLDHGLAMLAPQFPEYLFTRDTVCAELAVDPSLASAEAPVFLESCGLPGKLADRNPHSLSSGQRRRLALGLVLRSGRPLLLLDEPTAALDRRGKSLVLDALRDLPAGTTLVVASHDREFLALAGCAVLDLDDYSLAAAGPG